MILSKCTLMDAPFKRYSAFSTRIAAHPTGASWRTNHKKGDLIVRSDAMSGFEVDGQYRATSPKGWEIISKTLRARKPKFLKPAEVQKLASRNGTYVIDIRPDNEYNSGHVPGAINIQVCLGQRAAGTLESFSI
jgi:hypothetical protein